MLTEEGVRTRKILGRDNGSSVGIPGIGRVGKVDTPTGETTGAIKSGSDEPDNPLLQVLKDKILPETDSNDPSSGLLYFIFDGKPPKAKDLSLIYKFRGGRVVLDFKP